MTQKPSHDDLVKRLHTPGWRLAGDEAQGTLKQVLEARHARQAPDLIQHIETALELDAIQIQNLWHYLGLPTI